MKCPTCVEQGVESRVNIGAMFSTLMKREAYWDVDGTYHNHDPNHHNTRYTCSNGHGFTIRVVTGCPADGCDFTGSSKITVAGE